MHKRTTPLIFRRAKELHRNLTMAETKLWAHLSAQRFKDVHFRNQHLEQAQYDTDRMSIVG
jgi:very-short-patch-repair endonuclease